MGNTILEQPGQERVRREPSVDDAAERLLRVLPRMFKHLMAEVRPELPQAFPGGETQFRIVHALNHREYTLGELAERMEVTAPTVSRMIDTLVERGHVERHADAADRRKVWLRLTDDGRALARDMEACFYEAVARFLQPLSGQDLTAVVAACDALEALLLGNRTRDSKQQIREDQN